MPTPTLADSNNFEIMRVGFRRRLQDVVIYKKENDIFEAQGIIETGFPTNTRPTSGVRVGIAYTGALPLSLKNITINAVSGTSE